MSGARAARLFAALAAALCPRAAEGGNVYSRLEAGTRCADYLIPDIKTKEICFSEAATMAGVGDMQKLQVNGIGFNGCAVNTVAKKVIWSVSPAATWETSVALPTLEYICDGVPTTTTRTTNTLTTVTTTTTEGLFARLPGGETCHERGVPDIPTEDMCFNLAAKSTNLGDRRTMALDNIGFSGCVYNSAANVVLFGNTPGVTPDQNMQLPNFEYLCNGLPAPTVTLTSVLPTTTTTQGYSTVPKGTKCADHQMPGVASRELCFGLASAIVGLGDKPKLEVSGNGFTGCLFNTVADTVLWGETDGVTPETTLALPMWQYICTGVSNAPLYP